MYVHSRSTSLLRVRRSSTTSRPLSHVRSPSAANHRTPLVAHLFCAPWQHASLPDQQVQQQERCEERPEASGQPKAKQGRQSAGQNTVVDLPTSALVPWVSLGRHDRSHSCAAPLTVRVAWKRPAIDMHIFRTYGACEGAISGLRRVQHVAELRRLRQKVVQRVRADVVPAARGAQA